MNLSSPAKQKDDLFEVVLNTVSDGVTVIDKDLRIKFQNKVITQLYGSSMIGEQCYTAYRGRKEPCEDCKILEVLEDGQESTNSQLHYWRPTGCHLIGATYE